MFGRSKLHGIKESIEIKIEHENRKRKAKEAEIKRLKDIEARLDKLEKQGKE